MAKQQHPICMVNYPSQEKQCKANKILVVFGEVPMNVSITSGQTLKVLFPLKLNGSWW